MERYAQQHGITWVGVVVIIGLLAILLLIIMPGILWENGGHRSRGSLCLSNQRHIAMVAMMYAQDNAGSLPGALSWTTGNISSLHTRWVDDIAMTGEELHCPESNAAISYGIAIALAGGKMDMLPTGNATDALLSADANTIAESNPARVDGLLSSLTDIATTRHNGGFVASFLDGHVMYITPGKPGHLMIDAVDATAGPASQSGCDFLYQGADHLFVIDGAKGIVSGKSFTSTNIGRTHYFACYYAYVPPQGQGITIHAPGGPVTLDLSQQREILYALCAPERPEA